MNLCLNFKEDLKKVIKLQCHLVNLWALSENSI